MAIHLQDVKLSCQCFNYCPKTSLCSHLIFPDLAKVMETTSL